jgi:drug/metabolite transporter (DMT)-like permease
VRGAPDREAGAVNALLYMVTVLIWGSTWLAIEYQLGEVHPTASVMYRFALAAVLLSLWARHRKLPMRFGLKDHLYMALLGSLMFSTNYVLLYFSEVHLTSGLVAVIFSMTQVMNIVNGVVFFRRRVTPSVGVGAAFGLMGITTVFWPELANFNLSTSSGQGIALALGGTLAFSLGNAVSTRNQAAGLPVVQSNVYGMAYGAILTSPFALTLGGGLKFGTSPAYIVALLYLVLCGSVIAFGFYLTLLGRIGPERAAYATVLFPIIALVLSTLFEGFVWTSRALLGVILILMGNAIVLSKPKTLQALRLLRPNRLVAACWGSAGGPVFACLPKSRPSAGSQCEQARSASLD